MPERKTPEPWCTASRLTGRSARLRREWTHAREQRIRLSRALVAAVSTLALRGFRPWWTVVGLAGNALFSSRFLIQWLYSERKGRLVVPPVFWHLSFWGSLVVARLRPARGQATDPALFLPSAVPLLSQPCAPARGRPPAGDSGVDLVEHPRVGDGLAHVRQAAHPGDEALDAHAEAAVREGAVLAHVEVPLERLDRQVVLAGCAASSRSWSWMRWLPPMISP